MDERASPTSICPMCGEKTQYNQNLLGCNPYLHGFHAYCSFCRASFSNSKDPKNRVVVWDYMESNIYPQDTKSIQRLKKILYRSLNEGNRKKKEASICNEHSEDALTWSVFNTLEEYGLLNQLYAYLSGSNEKEDTRIFYWGHNDKYPHDEMIQEYVSTLQLAGEPNWAGGYSEPDILLFNPQHGLINIEVKYMSPNDSKLRDHRNQKRCERAQKMLEIGKKYVKTTQVTDWIWYELLRMWVPGCLVKERLNIQSFTLINLLPSRLLEQENGRVMKDMEHCLKLDTHFQFKQVTWEDFLQMIKDVHVIHDPIFWTYIQRKFP